MKNFGVGGTKPKKNALCLSDLATLKSWKWDVNVTSDHAVQLATQGFEELRSTSKLYQKYFQEVVPKQYNNSIYLFRHTKTNLTVDSFKAFAEGLFGAHDDVKAAEIPESDFLLRPYDYCQSWREHDYDGPNSENFKYKVSSIWNKTLADISKRLGFQYTLQASDIKLMYDMCRYEQAWHVERTSAWCAAFTPAQVIVFEYEDDMEYYYKSGYGYDGNERLDCHSIQDMLKHLESNLLPNVIAYFSHSSGLLPFITALGINKDDIKMTATNYEQMANRRWKTSNIDPFAANFVAVKYQCPADPIEKEKVIFFLNQNAVDLDWCNVGLCNWSEVLKRYDHFYKADCSTYYCLSGGAAGLGISVVSLLLTLIGYLSY